MTQFVIDTNKSIFEENRLTSNEVTLYKRLFVDELDDNCVLELHIYFAVNNQNYILL